MHCNYSFYFKILELFCKLIHIRILACNYNVIPSWRNQFYSMNLPHFTEIDFALRNHENNFVFKRQHLLKMFA